MNTWIWCAFGIVVALLLAEWITRVFFVDRKPPKDHWSDKR